MNTEAMGHIENKNRIFKHFKWFVCYEKMLICVNYLCVTYKAHYLWCRKNGKLLDFLKFVFIINWNYMKEE